MSTEEARIELPKPEAVFRPWSDAVTLFVKTFGSIETSRPLSVLETKTSREKDAKVMGYLLHAGNKYYGPFESIAEAKLFCDLLVDYALRTVREPELKTHLCELAEKPLLRSSWAAARSWLSAAFRKCRGRLRRSAALRKRQFFASGHFCE